MTWQHALIVSCVFLAASLTASVEPNRMICLTLAFVWLGVGLIAFARKGAHGD
jgi:hypothetical protein